MNNKLQKDQHQTLLETKRSSSLSADDGDLTQPLLFSEERENQLVQCIIVHTLPLKFVFKMASLVPFKQQ
ncbi:uncharacterized protein V6R79_022142 [Siganus canaliculatus]